VHATRASRSAAGIRAVHDEGRRKRPVAFVHRGRDRSFTVIRVLLFAVVAFPARRWLVRIRFGGAQVDHLCLVLRTALAMRSPTVAVYSTVAVRPIVKLTRCPRAQRRPCCRGCGARMDMAGRLPMR
jgi:hypothetical protein